MEETGKELIATYNGKNKLGFISGHNYKLKIIENKKRGYAVMTSQDLTDEKEQKLFCPYSSEISIRADWHFNE